MDERRDELERLANFALEECGEEACVAAIERALERVVTADDPEPHAITSGDRLMAAASMGTDNACWSLDAIYEAVRLELLQLAWHHMPPLRPQ